MSQTQSRRRFLTTLSAAGAAAFIRTAPSLAAEGPLETTAVRLSIPATLCGAPQLLADELLRAEGFSDVRCERGALARGDIDFAMVFAPNVAIESDAGRPLTVLGGVHVGCFEVFANEGIHTITDLKGKSVGVPGLRSPQHVFLTVIASYIGLDPVNDIRWVTTRWPKPAALFTEGKIDAYLGFPPEPQELRARHVGQVILSSAKDHPWSEHFCCMIAGNREFVRNYPAATKRVLRAILKATDLCVSDPQGVAKRLVDGGFVARYDDAFQALTEIPYDKWRDYNAEDTIGFYALRLREAGLIRSSPQKIIAEGTDWRFLNELKRELKA
jgi:NitT/TauT family transport system substrate-binding protein